MRSARRPAAHPPPPAKGRRLRRAPPAPLTPARPPRRPCSRFLWVSSGEPHAIRRRELLSKYGEQIRKLYGYDHATAYQVRPVGTLLLALLCF